MSATFTLVHAARQPVAGGVEPVLSHHEYDAEAALQAVDSIRLFDAKRRKVIDWLEAPKIGHKLTLAKGHVSIVIFCHGEETGLGEKITLE